MQRAGLRRLDGVGGVQGGCGCGRGRVQQRVDDRVWERVVQASDHAVQRRSEPLARLDCIVIGASEPVSQAASYALTAEVDVRVPVSLDKWPSAQAPLMLGRIVNRVCGQCAVLSPTLTMGSPGDVPMSNAPPSAGSLRGLHTFSPGQRARTIDGYALHLRDAPLHGRQRITSLLLCSPLLALCYRRRGSCFIL